MACKALELIWMSRSDRQKEKIKIQWMLPQNKTQKKFYYKNVAWIYMHFCCTRQTTFDAAAVEYHETTWFSTHQCIILRCSIVYDWSVRALRKTPPNKRQNRKSFGYASRHLHRPYLPPSVYISDFRAFSGVRHGLAVCTFNTSHGLSNAIWIYIYHLTI